MTGPGAPATEGTMLDLDGTQVWCEDRGEGPRPVVLLHAGGADSSMWDAVLPLLGTDRRVIRFDFPGSGRSPRPVAPVDLVHLTAAVLDALAVERADVVGVSQGGTVALDLAVERPDLVAAVVGMSCAGHDHLADEGPDYAGIGVFHAVATGDLPLAVERYLDLWCASTATPASDTEVRAQVEANVGSIALALTGLLRLPTWPTDQRLAEIGVPTLLVYGDDDDPALWRSGLRLSATIPGSRLSLMSRTDHLLPLRRPVECALLIRDFLGAVP